MEWAEHNVAGKYFIFHMIMIFTIRLDDDPEAAMLRRIYAFLRWTFEPDAYREGTTNDTQITCPALTEDGKSCR
jgi:hypothetical protein